jgi:DNA-binding MarR family transcriptional regulator
MASEGDDLQAAIAQLRVEMRWMTSYNTLFSQAVAERVGMHSSDIETLDLLNLLGPMTAGELSARTGLTTGATTRLIDRLEQGGWARRARDAADRRRVVVAPVVENLAAVAVLFEPLARRLQTLWSTAFTAAELRTVIEFARASNRVVSEESSRLRRPSEIEPRSRHPRRDARA